MIIGSCTAGYFRWPASEASGHWERLAGSLADLVQRIQGSVDRPSDGLIGRALACARAQQPSTALVNAPLPQGVGRDMPAKKQSLHSSARREIARRKPRLRVVEAQIASLERDPDLGLAARDHFIVWKRPCLFAAWPSVIQ